MMIESVFEVRLYDEHFAVAKVIGHAAGVAACGFLVERGVASNRPHPLRQPNCRSKQC